MNLYIFRAVGSYFGGAIGVIGESKELALEFLRNEQRRRRAAYEKWFNSSTNDPEPNVPHLINEPCYLTTEERSGSEDCFILSYEFPLRGGHTAGVVFCHAHEG